MNLGPQFDQPTLPGMGDNKGEQMTLFRTKELGDGTMRGTYNTSPDAADWVESTTREKVKPRDVDEQWRAPDNNLEFASVFDTDQVTDKAAERLDEGGDLYAEGREFFGSVGGETTNLVEGGRAHLAHLAQGEGVEKKFMGDFSEGTDFGDTRLHAKPYDFRELEFKDTPGRYEGLYTSFTPEGEQVSGMEYSESTELPRAQVVSGAGTGAAFRGHGYGTMTAARMAAERNDEGIVVHGNSFTDAGSAAFQKKGAKSEHQIDDEIMYRAENDPDIIDEASSHYDTAVLADMAGLKDYTYDEESDSVTAEGETFDRPWVAQQAARVYRSPVNEATHEFARDYVQSDMLDDQINTIEPFRPFLGVPGRSSTYGHPKQPTLESDPTERSSTPMPPNMDRLKNFYGQRGEAQPQDFLTRML